MKRPPCPAADSPDPDGTHIDLVLDPDKLRIDVYLAQGRSASDGQTSADLAPAGPENLLVFDGDHHSALLNEHHIEVRRWWYNPNKWLPVLASLMLYSTPRSLTTFATLLAGRKHGASRDEWLAHLAGEPGYQFGRWGQLRAAVGFAAAAVRFRAEDAADLAWTPADAVLRSRFLSGIFIVGSVIVVTVAIARHDGRYGLVTQIGSIGVLAAFLGWLIKAGREWRGVRPPEHRPRRSRG